jgi:electron transfer flavoprotein alpha/beta subunit
LPLVIGVEKSLCEPRYPSRSAVLHAAKQDIVLWGGRDLGLDASDMVPRVCDGSLGSPRPRPKWLPIPDSSWPARERIRFLLSRDVQEKRGEVVKEEPEKLVQRLVKFLRDNDLIGEETPDTSEQASEARDGTGENLP